MNPHTRDLSDEPTKELVKQLEKALDDTLSALGLDELAELMPGTDSYGQYLEAERLVVQRALRRLLADWT